MNRVIRVGAGGAGRCIVGCTGSNASPANQLSYPWTLAFDNEGNLFVIDAGNSRIQKFAIMFNGCSEFR